MAEKTKVLITVMTYPHPSEKYQESVCTAGVSEAGDWVRLYPVDYRYQPRSNQFHKYQWIEVELTRTEAAKDNRPESHRPNLESLRVLGEQLDTKHNWQRRRDIIDALPHRTLNEWKAQWEIDKTSLGIVRPRHVVDMEIRPANPEWKPKWKNEIAQMRLFGPPQKPLTKLPFSFHYIFECEDDAKPHTAMCEDWELGMLFLNERARLGSDEAAAESVKAKFFGEMCGATKDTRFFMGTKFPYNVWLVLGVFWPPRVDQPTLF